MSDEREQRATARREEQRSRADGGPSVALITGASRGLGRALAGELAAQGWHLIIDARDADALRLAAEQLSNDTVVVSAAGDVGEPDHRDALVRIARELGGVDALVNNAGALGVSPLPPLLSYPLDELERVFHTNVVAPLALAQALGPHLRPGAAVVNISSDAAREPYPGWGAYGASKAALEQLSAVLAAENDGLHVYWVDPGDMRTEMHQRAFPGEDISDRPPPDQSAERLAGLIARRPPSGRYRAADLGQVTGVAR